VLIGWLRPENPPAEPDDDPVMQIILARHGKPAWDLQTPIPDIALAEWLRGEADAPLDSSPRPSAELERLSRTAKCLITSPLRRSRDSARLLAPATAPLIDPCFREAELRPPFGPACAFAGAVGWARALGLVFAAGRRAWRPSGPPASVPRKPRRSSLATPKRAARLFWWDTGS